MSQAITLDELLQSLIKPQTRTIERRNLASPVVTKHIVDRRGRMPEFAPAVYDQQSYPVVGSIGDYKILIDPMLKVSRVVVSKRFRETLPELVDDLQKWMNDFFGYEYPIYIQDKQVLMHPESLHALKEKLKWAGSR